MYTVARFLADIKTIPANIAWRLADIAEAKGKQDLFTNQSPQKLKVLREHAVIESAVSSNRIEGIEMDSNRIGTVIWGKPLLQDRNEEEIKGYHDALQWIHTENNDIDFSEENIKKLHKITRGEIWDAGKYKETDSDIIERLPNGEIRLRFKTVGAGDTNQFMGILVSAYNKLVKNNLMHPLLAIAGCNLDFLCIHPFRDGNGRVSRLLLLLQLYQSGYKVGRYISLERLIEEHKDRYYETLEISSQRWHKGKHDPWLYINFMLYILKKAYDEFVDRVEKIQSTRGSKTDLITEQIQKWNGEFTLSQLHSKCPEVSRDMVRKVLKDLQKQNKVVSQGRGLGARWKRKGNNFI